MSAVQAASPPRARLARLRWPRFDSAACFAALLGNANNGRWQVAPAVVGQEAKVEVVFDLRRREFISLLAAQAEQGERMRSVILIGTFAGTPDSRRRLCYLA